MCVVVVAVVVCSNNKLVKQVEVSLSWDNLSMVVWVVSGTLRARYNRLFRIWMLLFANARRINIVDYRVTLSSQGFKPPKGGLNPWSSLARRRSIICISSAQQPWNITTNVLKSSFTLSHFSTCLQCIMSKSRQTSNLGADQFVSARRTESVDAASVSKLVNAVTEQVFGRVNVINLM